MHCTTLYNFFFPKYSLSQCGLLLLLLFFILQNPVHLVSALRLGDILIIGEERQEKRRAKREEQRKRSCPVPSVKTLYSVSWLSSVPHLNLKETTQRLHYCAQKE